MSPHDALGSLWRLGGLPPDALEHARLTGCDPVLPSSFAVGTAAQASVAAAALAACELGHVRGQARQDVGVDMLHAAMECTAWFSLDGRVADPWDKFSGLYRCTDGWVRVHANFAHHRDGALRLLGLDPATSERKDAQQALLSWRALDFEQAAADKGLVVAALRSFEAWDLHPQGMAVAREPLLAFEQIGDAPAHDLPLLASHQRPLADIKVLDLTRILAGPVCGRTLAAYGAEVMLLNAPHLPNITSIADTSRGKLSALADLRTAQGREQLDALLMQTHVFVQGYRPGALAALGYGPQELAARRPGMVCISLSAYGEQGPWNTRRGFDSLVQTATGFNVAEAQAAGQEDPKALPLQILDYASGFLMAYAASAALVRQAQQGGSWHVRVSLARVGQWIRQLGRVANGFTAQRPAMGPWLETSATGFGELAAPRHSAQLGRTPAAWSRVSMPPGSHPPVWPAT